MAPSLDKGKVAILVALQMAAQKLSLEEEYRDNVEQMQAFAKNALNLIEEVTPQN